MTTNANTNTATFQYTTSATEPMHNAGIYFLLSFLLASIVVYIFYQYHDAEEGTTGEDGQRIVPNTPGGGLVFLE